MGCTTALSVDEISLGLPSHRGVQLFFSAFIRICDAATDLWIFQPLYAAWMLRHDPVSHFPHAFFPASLLKTKSCLPSVIWQRKWS